MWRGGCKLGAILALADGSLFRGVSIGVFGETVGEVVFNTAMTGYQEILTDPSYAQQIVTLTYPHIGNVGINREDMESSKVQAAGLIIRDLPFLASNWRMNQSLPSYLIENKLIAISDIDTRRLTTILRQQGAMNGCIQAGQIDEERALAKAKAFPGLTGVDLAKTVTTDHNYVWHQGGWDLAHGYREYLPDQQAYHVVVYDFGVKFNILRLLADRGCRLTVVRRNHVRKDVLALRPDGVLLSNGPGDPAACDYAIKATKEFLAMDIPLFGICLGFNFSPWLRWR